MKNIVKKEYCVKISAKSMPYLAHSKILLFSNAMFEKCIYKKIGRTKDFANSF